MTTHEAPATFRTKVNLVLVPVVVRDKEGHAVGNLKKEDFTLFDKGKPQVISTFTMETLAGQMAEPPKPAPEPVAGALDAPAPVNPADMPKRFVAYFFDDIHLSMTDLVQVRLAAQKHIQESLVPTDRAAVYTSSGRTTQDFTDDRVKLDAALMKLSPQPIARATGFNCPDITYFEADLIVNAHDTAALNAATADTITCMSLDPTTQWQAAQHTAGATAEQVVNAGDAESRGALYALRDVVRRMSAMPGLRTIILVSPGFLTMADLFQDKTELIDRAIRANVVINSLNARGLYTVIPGGDASRPSNMSAGGQSLLLHARYQITSAQAEDELLGDLAYGTGGTLFHNSNDLVAGFKQVAARPAYLYLLGFSPANLKFDGRLHELKVAIKSQPKLQIQARSAYYAPRHATDPGEAAKEEIQEALFSREEMRDIPMAIHTQFFKPSADDARLAVLTHVDVRGLHFRKENGRNMDDLTIVSGLFDRDGNLVTGDSKTLQMKLKDQTLATRLNSGITLRSSFDVKPGSYFIRMVIRDSEGQLMAAANGSVDIPMN